MSVVTARDGMPSCGFCEGTGLWIDPDDPTTIDPCPLCDGSGLGPGTAVADPPSAPPPAAVAIDDVIALLPGLTQPERQRLYELLHARYDCRIYRR